MAKENKEQVKEQLAAELIWKEIENLPLDIFALPDQSVKNHCKPILIDPSKCYLEVKSPAVLPALESLVSNKYDVEKIDRFIVLSKKNTSKQVLNNPTSVVTVETK